MLDHGDEDYVPPPTPTAAAASRVLPGAAALAGMIVPAVCYFALTRTHVSAQRGWAIPAVADVAFALAVLAVLGRRVPPALRVFRRRWPSSTTSARWS